MKITEQLHEKKKIANMEMKNDERDRDNDCSTTGASSVENE